MAPERVVLVRHGETEWNSDGRLQGWAPVSLSADGQAQVRALGATLADEWTFDALIASDLSRTRESAARLAEQESIPDPTFDSGWRERNLGRLQGFRKETFQSKFPAYRLDTAGLCLDECPPAGERISDVYERVSRAWRDVQENHDQQQVLVVTHGGPLRIVVSHLTEVDLVTTAQELSVPNCAVMVVEFDPDPTLVQRPTQPSTVSAAVETVDQ